MLDQQWEHTSAKRDLRDRRRPGSGWVDPESDLAGNMLQIPVPTNPSLGYDLKYDAWNRLVEVNVLSLTVYRKHEYDGLNRRIVRVNVLADPDVTHDYYYNEDWQLLETRIGSSANPAEQFVWHPYYIDALAVRYWNGNADEDYEDTYEGPQFFLQDANFNVTAVVNASGAVLERYDYTPYGGVTFMQGDFDASPNFIVGEIDNRHLFTGRELDPVTGLQLNRHRYYHAILGRWVTRDPIGYEGGSNNLYEYVNSNPVDNFDASGEMGGFKWCGGKKIDARKCCKNGHPVNKVPGWSSYGTEAACIAANPVRCDPSLPPACTLGTGLALGGICETICPIGPWPFRIGASLGGALGNSIAKSVCPCNNPVCPPGSK